jgi:hypothetical protein
MPNRKALVTQHLENLSRRLLEEYQDIIREFIHGRQGVYALYRKDKLYYVGLATNLPQRLKAHMRDQHRGLWDRFSVYLTIGDEHMRELESLILRITKPTGNKVKGIFAKSENLLRKMRWHYRQKSKEEEKSMFLSPKVAAEKAAKKTKTAGGKSKVASYLVWRKIRGTISGKTYWAILRANGTIRYNGKIYDSPSAAARKVVGYHTNGWHFWKYERSPGDWVRLSTLRK